MRKYTDVLWIIILLGVLFAVAFSIVACGDDDDEKDSGDDVSDDDDTDDDDLLGDDDDAAGEDKIDVVKVTVEEASEGNPLARKILLETNLPCSLSGIVTSPEETGFTPSDPAVSPVGINHEFWFYGLLEDTSFSYIFFQKGKSATELAQGTFRTPVLPDFKPVQEELSFVADLGFSDWYMVGHYQSAAGHILNLVYDRKGRLRFFHETDSGHFSQVMENGDIVSTAKNKIKGVTKDGTEYTLFEVQLEEPVNTHSHHKTYIDLVEPETAMVIFNRSGPGVECNLTTPTENMIGDGMAQIDATGQELWRWDVFDHTDQIPPETMDQDMCYLYHLGPGTYDWTHANAIEKVADQNAYLFSLRNVMRLIKVDRDSSDILWQMGPDLDFTWIGDEPEDEHWFRFQHDPHWLDGNRLLIYDNGHCRYEGESCISGPWSRALELLVDENLMTVEQIWEYRVPFDRVQGNLDRQGDGNTLIATGGGNTTIEVSAGGGVGDELFIMQFPSGTVRAQYYPPLWIE